MTNKKHTQNTHKKDAQIHSKKPGSQKNLETESGGGRGGGLQNSFPEKRKLFNTTRSLTDSTKKPKEKKGCFFVLF